MPAHIIQGSTLHYQDHGAGFPVLLGHSYLWDAAMWAPQIDALSRSYRVIVPDLWGHGASGAPPDGTGTGMADLLAFLATPAPSGKPANRTRPSPGA